MDNKKENNHYDSDHLPDLEYRAEEESDQKFKKEKESDETSKFVTGSILIVIFIVLVVGGNLYFKFGKEEFESLKAIESNSSPYFYRKYKIEGMQERSEVKSHSTRHSGTTTTTVSDRVYISFRSLEIDSVYVFDLPFDQYYRDQTRFKFEEGDIVEVKFEKEPFGIVSINEIRLDQKLNK